MTRNSYHFRNRSKWSEFLNDAMAHVTTISLWIASARTTLRQCDPPNWKGEHPLPMAVSKALTPMIGGNPPPFLVDRPAKPPVRHPLRIVQKPVYFEKRQFRDTFRKWSNPSSVTNLQAEAGCNSECIEYSDIVDGCEIALAGNAPTPVYDDCVCKNATAYNQAVSQCYSCGISQANQTIAGLRSLLSICYTTSTNSRNSRRVVY